MYKSVLISIAIMVFSGCNQEVRESLVEVGGADNFTNVHSNKVTSLAELETYTDAVYGYSVSYPKDWKISNSYGDVFIEKDGSVLRIIPTAGFGHELPRQNPLIEYVEVGGVPVTMQVWNLLEGKKFIFIKFDQSPNSKWKAGAWIEISYTPQYSNEIQQIVSSIVFNDLQKGINYSI